MSAKVDLDALDTAARSATPGPWAVHPGTEWVRTFGGHGRGIASCDQRDSGEGDRENATHIAAADPTTVLALIARIRELDLLLGEVMADVMPQFADDPLYARIEDMLIKGVTR